MKKSTKNIFLIILDSVRRDDLFYIIKDKSMSELREDFIDFRNCNSIYTNTFLSHYALFFGDYLYEAKYQNFPAQLKNLGYKNRSFCNYAVLLGYPYFNSSVTELEEVKYPSITKMIEDLGIEIKFDLENKNFGKKVEDFYGAADDIKNKSPAKWKDYLQHINTDKTFTYLHFWTTHHNYGINNFLKNKINGMNYVELAENLVKSVIKKDITLKFMKKIYYRKIYEVINTYLKEFIQILKDRGIYEECLIILTADHGEGHGDIGYNLKKSLLPLYFLVKRIYRKIGRDYIKRLPELRKIFSCKWDRIAFFHNGGYEIQKQIPLLIKFPKNIFGGIKYYKEVSLFDIVHTINDFTGSSLKLNSNKGCSLNYLINEGENAREKYRLNKSIKKSFQYF